MARQLWLLRHGEAVPHDAAASDSERELTDRGRDQSRAAGHALKALEVEVHLCFTSPKVRARQTADLACESLDVDPVDEDSLAEGFDGRAALDLMRAAGEDQRVLVVGHEPDFSQVVYDLTGGRVDFKKGGIAGIRLEGSKGELIVLLRPRETDRIG
jgi:phosphohistidine phosphatase